MSDSNLEKVQAAGLLSSLAGLFFKGIDKALSDIAEYEEEMGVLKQVNRIPIETLDGKNTYTLTIKLSPVRGKDSVYYIEAETDAPGLNVDKLNNKTMSINKDNAREFRSIVDKLISSSNYVANMKRDVDEDTVAEEESETQSKDDASKGKSENEGNLTQESKLRDVVDTAEEWFQQNPAVVMGNGLVVNITVEFTDLSADGSAKLELTVVDALQNKGQAVKGMQPQTVEIDLIDEDDNVISAESLVLKIKDLIKKYANKCGLDANSLKYVQSSTTVSATFIKDKDGVGLTAIRASSDLDKSMEIVYNLMDSDEFVDSLEDDKATSFNITETSDNYDIEEVDKVFLVNTYSDLYKEVSRMYVMMNTLERMIGVKIWKNDNFFNELQLAVTQLQTAVATMYINNDDVLPVLLSPFELVPSFEKYASYTDNSMIPQIKENLTEDLKRLLDVIEFLSVNLEVDEQCQLAKLADKIETQLN